MQFYHAFCTVYMYNTFKYLLQFKLYLPFTCFSKQSVPFGLIEKTQHPQDS